MGTRLSELEPWLRPYAQWLVQVAEYNGMRVAITSVRRSPAQQSNLWNRYLTCQRQGGSCLPAAPPGSSKHERGLAWDMVVNGDYHSPAQRAIGTFWRGLGGFWSEADPVHFSVR